MDHYQHVARGFQTHIEHISLSVDAIADVASRAAQRATEALIAEKKLFSIGIGADASCAVTLGHLLHAGIFRERPPLPVIEVIARQANPISAATHWAAEQLQALGQPGDVALVFASQMLPDEVSELAVAAQQRELDVFWIGAQGPDTSLLFPEAPAATQLLLGQAAAICLSELIDVNAFGAWED